MSTVYWAAVVTAALVAATVLPAAWVLAREALRRIGAKRAIAAVEEARRSLGDGSDAPIGPVCEALTKRFDALTVERAVLMLLRSEDAGARAWGGRLFGELGLVERYSARVREARKWSERTHAAEVLGLAASPAAVPALVAAIRDRHEDDASVKVAAAAALARMRDASAIPLLVSELERNDERSSRNIAEALVAFGGLAVPALLELLIAPSHPPARVWAARVLGHIGDARATDALVARLYDRDDLLRMAAAEALEGIGDGRALQPLVRATLRDPAPQVRAHAAAAVAKIEGERAIDVLIAALADPDYSTRLRALEAFETMRITDTSPLEAALRDPNAEVRRRAALALERVGYLDRVVGELTAESHEVRQRAEAALLELGRVGLIDSVASYLHHASFEVRAVAARACGELREARVGPLVLGAVEDEAWPVRASVCEALGKLPVAGAAAALVVRLRDDEEPVREAAAEALTSLSPKELEPHTGALLAAYEEGSVPVRVQVVILASRIDGGAGDGLLVRASTDPSDTVRLRAVAGLGGRPGQITVQALVACLTDASIDVRMAAVTALGSATSTEAFEGLLRALGGAPPDIRDRIAESLSRGAPELLFARLDELERSPSSDVRLGIAWTLGKTGDARAVPTLARFLVSSDAALRASAAGALGKITAPTAIAALRSVAEDPDGRVRAAVVNALGRGEKDERVLDVLAARAADPDAFVRNRALVALARMGQADAESRVLALGLSASPAAYLVASALVGTETSLARVLDAIATDAVLKPILAFLDHEDPPVRAAFFAVLRIEDPIDPSDSPQDAAGLAERYEQVLRTSLDVESRKVAVTALRRLRTDRGLEALAGALAADPSDAVRLHAVEALRTRTSDALARKALVRAVADPNPDVAVHAARALLDRREPDVASALARRLGAGTAAVQEVVEEALAEMHRDDPAPFIDRVMGVDVPELLAPAVRVLGRMALPQTLPLLRELARSNAGSVRAASVRALGALAMPEAAALVEGMAQDPAEDVRVAVLDATVWTGDALMRTATLRRDPSPLVRAHAAEALERMPAPFAEATVVVLEGMLADGSAIVRAAALASLVTRGERAGLVIFGRAWAQAPLETREALKAEPRGKAISARIGARLTTSADPDERRLAVMALGAFATPGFHVHVLPALADPSPEVRSAAAAALTSVDDAEVRARLARLVSDPDSGVRDVARRSMMRTVR